MHAVGDHPTMEQFNLQHINSSHNSIAALKQLHESVLKMAQQPTQLSEIVIGQNISHAIQGLVDEAQGVK